MSVLAFLTAFWVVCPYVCAASEAGRAVHVCCTEMEGARVSPSTLCCGSMGRLYLPTAGQELVSAPLASLAALVVSYFEFQSTSYLTTGVHLLEPPRTLVSEKIALLI